MHRGLLGGVAGGVVLLSASAVAAHDTWLLPARFEVAPGASIALELTSGMKFPDPESAVAPDRIAASGVRLGGKTLALEARGPSKGALRLSATATTPGVAVLWAASKPRTLSLTPDQVRHYLEEIGAPLAVEARWRQQQRWRESYTKLAKTYVRVGAPEGGRSWAEPVGLALEMLPDRDPTSLRAGDELSVTVLKSGQPLPGLAVSAVAAVGRKPFVATTGADGRVTFTLDRAGPWLLKATLLQESIDADVDWHSLFTTLTVAAGPRP